MNLNLRPNPHRVSLSTIRLNIGSQRQNQCIFHSMLINLWPDHNTNQPALNHSYALIKTNHVCSNMFIMHWCWLLIDDTMHIDYVDVFIDSNRFKCPEIPFNSNQYWILLTFWTEAKTFFLHNQFIAPNTLRNQKCLKFFWWNYAWTLN